VLVVDDIWEPDDQPTAPLPPTEALPATSAAPEVIPAPSRGPELLQPKYVIGLAVGAVMVLVIGLIVVFTGGGDGDLVAIDPGTTLVTGSTEPSLTTTPIVLDPSATTTTTSTTSTSTTSTTAPPLPAFADAGEDLVADAGSLVTLAALDLSEENQSVVWRQMAGPDVTETRGRLLGAEVQFSAPERPATLLFEVTVTGRGGDQAIDELRVDVLLDSGAAVFVDVSSGSDSGNGTMERPFRTLSRAASATGGGKDIYLRSTGNTYDLGNATLGGGTSIFGGYDADWVRDVERPALVTGADGLRLEGRGEAILSALQITGPDRDGLSDAVNASGLDRLLIEDSSVEGGESAASASTGLFVEDVTEVVIARSEISGGRGGNGLVSPPAVEGGAPGTLGASADSRFGAVGGDNGGTGGTAGDGLTAGLDGSGPGGAGGAVRQNGAPGGGGAGGLGGAGGAGGSGTITGPLPDPTGAPGSAGASGAQAEGGGGGGGGGGATALAGGGGAGGGGGGLGGAGGFGGVGGSGSIGVMLVDVERVTIVESSILGGIAGDGGTGGNGASGRAGGPGGVGAPAVSSSTDTSGAGGGGGGGGAGGQGGQGGGGAGGASVGLITARVGEVVVSDSEIRGGSGGAGGVGGLGGAAGAAGATGSGRNGGAGGQTSSGARSASGTPAKGGDSIGWWDTGAERTVEDSTVAAGTPGAGGRAVGSRF
jgi:hypothetical protein